MEELNLEEPQPSVSETPPTVPPPRSQLNLISYLLIGLLAVIWPLASFYFLDDQTRMAEEITSPLLEVYLPTIVLQLAVLLVVLIALRSEPASLRSIGFANYDRWSFPIAVLFFVVANIVMWILQVLLLSHDPTTFANITSILPDSALDKGVWVLLCAVVAVSEEVTFRGYLLTRISSLAGGRLWAGVIISTLAFASGHLYQGIGGFIVIFVYGMMFAALYLGTRSLWPGLIAHFLQDVIIIFLPATLR